MWRVSRNLFLWLSLAVVSQGQEPKIEPQQIGDLLITLTGASAPPVLMQGQDRIDPPSDRYWVVAEVTFQNGGNVPICARFTGALRAEQGIVAGRAGFLPAPALSDLQPGEEMKARFIFTLKRGAKPLELTIATDDYGRDCGDRLPASAAASVHFPVRGVSSPPPTASAPHKSRVTHAGA
jgi:hypothetical protein